MTELVHASVSDVRREAAVRAGMDLHDPKRVLVGMSAAKVWGLPIPPSVGLMGHELAVAEINHEGRRSRKNTVSGHRLLIPPDHVTTVHGVHVTSVERTWVDCAALVTEEHLLAMGDHALQIQLLDGTRLEAVMRWAAGRRGIRRARCVAMLLRPGVESPQESRLRWLLLNHGLPEPEINPWVVIQGHRYARLDLAYTPLRIGIEYDGDWHAMTQEHDQQRRMGLSRHGWAIVVAHKEDFDNPDALLKKVQGLMQERQISRRRRW